MPSKKSGHFAATFEVFKNFKNCRPPLSTREQIYQHLPLQITPLQVVVDMPDWSERDSCRSFSWTEVMNLTWKLWCSYFTWKHPSRVVFILHFLHQASSQNEIRTCTEQEVLLFKDLRSKLDHDLLHLSFLCQCVWEYQALKMTITWHVILGYTIFQTIPNLPTLAPALLSSPARFFFGRQSNAPVAFRGGQR